MSRRRQSLNDRLLMAGLIFVIIAGTIMVAYWAAVLVVVLLEAISVEALIAGVSTVLALVLVSWLLAGRVR